MKKVIPKQTVDVCDFCQREGYIETCWVCGRQFCSTHNGIVPRSYGFTTVCRECGNRTDVLKVCHKWAAKLSPLFQKRDEELKALPKKEVQESMRKRRR